MKTTLLHKNLLSLLILVVFTAQLKAQEFKELDEMEVLENRVLVQNSHESVWNALSLFGNVSRFNASIDDSVALNGSVEQADLGAEREVQIPDGINNIINKERIVTFVDGINYTYEVYETENFPTKKMYVTYGIRLDAKGRTILYTKTFYQLNNKFNNKLLKRKLNRLSMDSLLAYKYYIENGEKDTDIKVLRKRYQKEDTDYDNVYAAMQVKQ